MGHASGNTSSLNRSPVPLGIPGVTLGMLGMAGNSAAAKRTGIKIFQPQRTGPDAPWCWNIYLQNWAILGVNVGKYSSTMVRIWVGTHLKLRCLPPILMPYVSTQNECLKKLS